MTEPDPLAAAAMVAYCGWDPTAVVTNATVLLDGSAANGSRVLTLPSLYVTDVASVVVTDIYGTTAASTVEPLATPVVGSATPADVDWSENGCLTWRSYTYPGWPAGRRNIAVTYSGGYQYPPDDLMAALASISRRSPYSGATSQRVGTASVNYGSTIADGGLLLIEQMVFDRYRLMRAA